MQTKIILLLVTGLPGLFKLLSLILIKYQFDDKVLGLYTSDISIVFTISLFTGIGWSALLLKLVPSRNDGRSIQTLFNICIYTMVSVIFLVPLLYLGYYFGYIFDINNVIFLLFTVSLYYVMRHFLLAKRKYTSLFIIELSIMFIFITLFITISNKYNLLFITSLSFLASIVYIFLYFYKLNQSNYKMKFIVGKKNIFQGIQFSFNSLISGGVVTILPVIFMQFGGVVYAGFAGLITNLINAMMLVPRAIANFKIISLQLAIKNKEERKELFSYRKIMFISNFLGCIIGIGLSYLFINYEVKYSNLAGVYIIATLLIIAMFTSSQNMVEGNYLFLKEMQRYNIISNVAYFSMFLILYFLLTINQIFRLDILIFGLSVLSITRYLYLTQIVNSKLNRKGNS